ncbi:HAMP domain-containing histidine kinase [Clostridioides difficile]|uniref:sensor histidine kinase n=2 Tax=Clostridioides difficile TaxID=1496 RepID=UPI001FACE6E9|nr:HAMP domain-containing sensor histidine kinase [Clostridioides difficile]MCJ0223703.1 HAMP domain-containing histidine kinase [Clostridioides difficile]MCJ0430297.1 HAMP domain-containing histidine kinase [Clostridioides difficile]MCJ0436218.1 HAMP domain-containing histidine kinase [Clostridioides difficile]MCU6147126.1 HAMP domain-containing histidine kinase [Clostridioides difficile]
MKMDEQTIILFLLLLSIGLLFLSIFAFSKLGHIYKRLKDIEEILADVQIGDENRKILIKPCDVMAPLVYQLNEIVYDYENKLLSLKKSDKASKQLMTSLSHDVRTPLTTLIGYLDAVHSGIVIGQEREEYLEIARCRAYDLKDYIDVLFDWFRLNSDEFTLSIESVEIAELSRNILKDWIPIFHEKKLNFEIDIPENRLMVNLDPDGYSRVVNNLVQNVLAHSKARQIKITMSEDSRMVLLRVEDDGVGIARENLPHIFERLYKCDKGRSEKGSGLGLSIVSQMVERMGGQISVESEIGKYTIFTVSLPLI